MASLPDVQIVVIGKVTENKVINGSFHRLQLDCGNGKHHEYAVLRKGADKTATKNFNNAKVGSIITLGGCFASAFVYRPDDARVTFRALTAN